MARTSKETEQMVTEELRYHFDKNNTTLWAVTAPDQTKGDLADLLEKNWGTKNQIDETISNEAL